MKPMKTTIFTLLLALIMMLTLAACGGGSNKSSSTFPNIDNADIPDILEKTVGTLGNTYFTSGISDDKDYQAFLAVTFENTTDADYTTLMEHYQSASTGTDENGSLLFDWGWLQVTPDNGSITINAHIK